MAAVRSDLFDALGEIVSSGQRQVRALEAANLLPGAVFHSEAIPTNGPIGQRRHTRQEWLRIVLRMLHDADLVFADPDNGLEPAGFSYASGTAGKSVTLDELRQLRRPGRCVIVYHHHTRQAGGHHAEIEHWAGRLREAGVDRVDALRAKPWSPRVFFLLDAPDEVRQRAERVADSWKGLITWHPGVAVRSGGPSCAVSQQPSAATAAASPTEQYPLAPSLPRKASRARNGTTTQVGYVNRNQQEVIRPTGKPGTDHGQYVFVLRCRACGHEYGANGSDIWLRRCPAHDGGAVGLAI